jgi:hypothetical protein
LIRRCSAVVTTGLCCAHDRLAAEFNISESLVKQFMADEGFEDI